MKTSKNGKKREEKDWPNQDNPTLFLWYIQYDNRWDGENSWEEMVVRATTREDAIEIGGADVYDQDHIYISIIGTAPEGDSDKCIVCWGIHDQESSWEFLRREIRYETSNRGFIPDELLVYEPIDESDEEPTDDLEPDDL